jgi:CubicO group peptidase (beta-lactamase class C family)
MAMDGCQQPTIAAPPGFGLGVSLITDPEKYGRPGSAEAFGWPGAFGGWWQADPAQDMVALWLQECLLAPSDGRAAPNTRIARVGLIPIA